MLAALWTELVWEMK